MKKYKEVKTITTIDEKANTKTKTITTQHTIRNWNELTNEEKEKEIENRKESIYENYQNDLYEDFKIELDEIKVRYPYIEFDTVYLDGNSQGNWIEKVNKLHLNYPSINIYGEWIGIDDIDLHIRKYIDNFNLFIYDYYIDSENMEKIKNTKKYKKWYNNIENDVNNWINEVNKICKDILSKEYYYPYDLNDEDDKEYLDWYFENEEFETIEVIENDNL